MGPLLFLVVTVLAAGPPEAMPWATGESRGEDLEVALVTFGPGEEVETLFGHTALVVTDRRLGKDRLYNYGEFSFDRLTIPRYALGHLDFWVGARPVLQTYAAYQREGRSVRGAVLALTSAQKVELARALAHDALPENRTYRYDHFTDNCATRPRDVLDRVLDGALRAAGSGPARMSLRDHVRRHTAKRPVLGFLIDFLLGADVDEPITRWQEAFLPAELEAQVHSLHVTDDTGQATSLVASEWTFFDGALPEAPATPPAREGVLLLIGVSAGAVAIAIGLWRRKRHRAHDRGAPGALVAWSTCVALALGVPGTALFVMACFTDHVVTRANANLLLASPLTLLAAPLCVVAWRSSRWQRWTTRAWSLLALVAIAAVALRAAVPQDNGDVLALLVPAILGVAIAWRLGRPAP